MKGSQETKIQMRILKVDTKKDESMGAKSEDDNIYCVEFNKLSGSSINFKNLF
jgi:hypothetical protein